METDKFRSVVSTNVYEMMEFVEHNIHLFDECIFIMPDVPKRFSLEPKVSIFTHFDVRIFDIILDKQHRYRSAGTHNRLFLGIHHKHYNKLNHHTLFRLVTLTRTLKCYCWLVVPLSARFKLSENMRCCIEEYKNNKK